MGKERKYKYQKLRRDHFSTATALLLVFLLHSYSFRFAEVAKKIAKFITMNNWWSLFIISIIVIVITRNSSKTVPSIPKKAYTSDAVAVPLFNTIILWNSQHIFPFSLFLFFFLPCLSSSQFFQLIIYYIQYNIIAEYEHEQQHIQSKFPKHAQINER